MVFRRRCYFNGVEKSGAMAYLSRNLTIRLTDLDKMPVSGGRCRVKDDPETIYPLNENGIAVIPVKAEWGPKLIIQWELKESLNDAEDDRFYWESFFDLAVIASADDAACEKRLTHLGFSGKSLNERVSKYQSHFNRITSGELSEISKELIDWHDGGKKPDVPVTDAAFLQTTSAAPSQTLTTNSDADDSVEIILMDYCEIPLENAKCKRTDGGDTDTVYTANSEGVVEIPIASGTSSIRVVFEPEFACEVENGPRFYMNKTVQINS